MTNDDIVFRLRAVLHYDRSVELMNREAADEIERLRNERDEARRSGGVPVCSHFPDPERLGLPASIDWGTHERHC